MKRWSKADQWLIEEIKNELRSTYFLSEMQIVEMMRSSSFYRTLENYPYFTHHESIQKWAMIIVDQNKGK